MIYFGVGQYAHNTQIIDLVEPGGGALKFHQLGEDNSTIGMLFTQAGSRQTVMRGKRQMTKTTTATKQNCNNC